MRLPSPRLTTGTSVSPSRSSSLERYMYCMVFLLMAWKVEFHRDFLPEFLALKEPVQDEIAALAEKMKVLGPMMKRPAADTLDGSRFSNMKELRFTADNGVWRVAYAFDPSVRPFCWLPVTRRE